MRHLDQPSRFPLQEIRDQPQAETLALLRVELRADHGVAAHDRGDRTAVIGVGDKVCGFADVEMVGMDEIRVQSVRSGRNAVEQRMRPLRIERVPAQCGIFRFGSAGVMRSTSPGIQPSPGVTTYSRPRSAMSCMPTQMPRNGRPCAITLSLSASTMPGTASRPRRQSANAPTPGSTTRSAWRTLLGSLVTTIG